MSVPGPALSLGRTGGIAAGAYPGLLLVAGVAAATWAAGTWAVTAVAAVFGIWYLAVALDRAHAVTLAALALVAVFGDRLIVQTSVGGGSGIVRIASLAIIALVTLSSLVNGRVQSAMGDMVRWGSPFMLFVSIGIVLPAIALLAGQPPRTLAAAMTPLLMAAACALGAVLACGHESDTWHERTLLAIVVLGAAFGTVQFLAVNGADVPLGAEIMAWDVSITSAHGIDLIRGRAIGPYLNPNVFSAVGGFIALYGLFGRTAPRTRAVLLVASSVMIVLGQSRGVVVALAAAVLVHLLLSRLGPIRPAAVAVTAGTLTVIGAALALAAERFPAFTASVVMRFGSGLAALTGAGVTADANLAGRVEFWRRAGALVMERPFGTFGPPEALLGTAVDSDMVRLFVQGGPLYLGSFLLLLWWLIATSRAAPALSVHRSLAVYIGVLAVTQIPTAYTGIAVVLGLACGRHLAELCRISTETESSGDR